MNRARQDSITTEIMEIVGGAEALRPTAAKAISTTIRLRRSAGRAHRQPDRSLNH